MVFEADQRLFETLLIPASIAAWAKERRPLIVVDAMYAPAELVKVRRYFAANKAGRSRHKQNSFGH